MIEKPGSWFALSLCSARHCHTPFAPAPRDCHFRHSRPNWRWWPRWACGRTWPAADATAWPWDRARSSWPPGAAWGSWRARGADWWRGAGGSRPAAARARPGGRRPGWSWPSRCWTCGLSGAAGGRQRWVIAIWKKKKAITNVLTSKHNSLTTGIVVV